jgi:tetratricopeptide (TPR) repeat protein
MKLISIIILVLIVAVGWFVVVPMVAPGVTEKTVVRDAQVTLGDTCALMNQSELALTMYEGALSANATDPVLLKKKGAMLIKCGRANEAETIYQQVLSQNANDTVALIKTGDSMVKQGKLTEAITYYDAALAISPRDASTLMKKGDAYLVMSVAETQNLKVGSITDSGTSAGTQAPSSAQQMETMQSYQNAMTAYQKAMEIDPKLSLMISTRVMGATQTQVSSYQDILNNINK